MASVPQMAVCLTADWLKQFNYQWPDKDLIPASKY